MRRLLSLTFALSLVAMLLPATAQAATTTLTVEGRFIDAKGAPVAQVDVQTSESDATTTSNTDGEFSLSITEPSGPPPSIDVSWYDGSYFEFNSGDRWVTANGDTYDAGTISLTRFQPYPKAAKDAVRTSDRSAVSSWYRSLRALVKKGGTGSSVHGCRVAAQPSRALRQHTLGAINLMRALSGENPVRLRSSYSKDAQQAALIAYWNGLTHTPPKSSKCWSKAGYAGASHSNLSSGDAGASVVLDYMSDNFNLSGPDAGHRSWLIDPATRYMGVGPTTGAGAIYVVDADASQSNPTRQWISWPTAGYFPRQIEPGGLWSFMTTQTGYDLSHASVHVYRGSSPLHLTRYYVDGYGGQSGLVFQLRMPTSHGVTKAGTYSVTVSGIQYRGATQHPYTYRVTLI